MRKTVFIITEKHAPVPEQETRKLVSQRVALWLKEALKKQ